MLSLLAAIGFTLALWWFSTVAILYLDRRPAHTFAASMAGGTVLLAVALWAVIQVRYDTSVGGAYIGFAAGIAIWGWQLLSFYLGYVTGPRRHACEPGLNNRQRFVEGVKTSLYHELVVIGFACLLLFMTWDAANRTALWTYLVLYWMHQSAKLNLFFGSLNHGEALLPESLRYLASFMRRRPMNLLFPVSVTFSIVITTLLAQAALNAEAHSYEAASFAMIACLMALAVLEHWLLVLPLPVDALWQWGMGVEPEGLSSNKESRRAADYGASGSDFRGAIQGFESDYEDPPKPAAHVPFARSASPSGAAAKRESISLLKYPEPDIHSFKKARPSDAF